MDLLSGLLGGVQGGASAVNTLSEERRKALAEQVRMEALDLMNKRQQERGFAHSKDLQQGQFSHTEGMQGRQFEHAGEMQRGGFEHAENMQGRQFEHAEGLLGKQLSSAERRHQESLAARTDETGTAKADLASKDAHNKINEVYKTLLDNKWKEGQKLPSWAMTQINAIRRDAGMPELSEEETKVPKWLGARSETKYTYDEGLLPTIGTTEPVTTEKETPKDTKSQTTPQPKSGFNWQDYVPEEATKNISGAGPLIQPTPKTPIKEAVPQGPDYRHPVDKIAGVKSQYQIDPTAYKDVRVDKVGTIWGVDSNGKPVRIARKPSETVRDSAGKKHPSPEYAEYLKLLQEFGLK